MFQFRPRPFSILWYYKDFRERQIHIKKIRNLIREYIVVIALLSLVFLLKILTLFFVIFFAIYGLTELVFMCIALYQAKTKWLKKRSKLFKWSDNDK